MDNIIIENVIIKPKSKAGRPNKSEISENLWLDDEYRKQYHKKHYANKKEKLGMGKCEECGFECASNYLAKHKLTKYHLQYVERHKIVV